MASRGELSHNEISRRFVDAGVFNFEAMGKLIAEIGPDLAINDSGIHGVTFGKFHVLACMLQANDVFRIGDLQVADVAARAVERIADGGIVKG